MMENKKDIKSVLNMEKMVFDKIEFKRLGLKSDQELKLQMKTIVGKSIRGIYKTTLILTGTKLDEYSLAIQLSGFFTFSGNDDTLSEDTKETLLRKNSVAILLPYLRSEVSILTAQPGMECVVLPILNVNTMIDEKE